MSRIGKKVIEVPDKVTVNIEELKSSRIKFEKVTLKQNDGTSISTHLLGASLNDTHSDWSCPSNSESYDDDPGIFQFYDVQFLNYRNFDDHETSYLIKNDVKM